MKHLIVILILAGAGFTWAADVIEFLNGSQLEGKVLNIAKADRAVEFEATVGGQIQSLRYPYSAIHAVTWNGKRYVVTEKPDAGVASAAPHVRVERTRAEVDQLIDRVGKTPPDWFSSTPLAYPKSLDLAWPNPPQNVWDDRKYIGHYIWDVINPNEAKWREGVRFLHHVVEQNQGNRQVQVKAMNQLGTLYASLLEDWPRAAFWWRQAGTGTQGAKGQGGFRVGYEVGLAKCYWEMGSAEMAREMLDRASFSTGAVHLWAEMGDNDRAIRLANQEIGRWVGHNLLAGDICRHAGRYDEALKYYQAGLAVDRQQFPRVVDDAKDRLEALQAEQALDLAKIRDGTYKGRSLGYSDYVQVDVTVRAQRITRVQVTRHEEKQYYSSLTDIPNQIIQKQSVKGIDATASATITAEAVVRAAALALQEGM